MTTQATKLIREARDHQLLKNDARRILTRVTEARKNPADAGSRWPFELLQNAYDAGPADGATPVSVQFGWREGDSGERVVFFEHRGAPFTSADIAALLSGGSNKEFDSDVTTGRFGTGFLVTHVLALLVTVEGLLQVGEALERFAFELDRSGNEHDIMANRASMEAAFEGAQPVQRAPGSCAARFTWLTGDLSSYARGVAALQAALPHVFGTCPALGRVEIRGVEGDWLTWSAARPSTGGTGTLEWTERRIEVSGQSAATRRLILVRVPAQDLPGVAAQFLGEECEDGVRIVEPPEGFARVFRRFPVRGTTSVPISVILDGPFDVDQERRNVALAPEDRALIAAALQAGVDAAPTAVSLGFIGAARLARAAEPSAVDDPDDRRWWAGVLKDFAEALAGHPLVLSDHGYFGALAGGAHERWADFPLPQVEESGHGPEFPLPRMRTLMAGAESCDPPALEVVDLWASIAAGWASLDVPIRRVCLRSLADEIRGSGKTWAAIRAVTSSEDWLVDFLDVVGAAWKARRGADTSLVNGLLPDQTGTLRSAPDLERDGGIPERLKDVADELGVGVRTSLLHLDIQSAAVGETWPNLGEMLKTALPRLRTWEQVVDACVKRLETLPLEKRLDESGRALAEVAVRLIGFLWDEHAEGAERWVQRIPLLTRAGTCDRAGGTKMMMLPVSRWRERARPFLDAWPASRVLDELFASESLAEALCNWGLAHPDPLIEQRASELKGPRLAGMAWEPLDDTELEGLVVRDQTFTQIALLQPEVMNHCVDVEHAAALLGLVVDCLAREDVTWKVKRELMGRQRGEDRPIELRDALWLGDLRSRAWVPVATGEQGETARVRATAESLRALLDAQWLLDNPSAVELLSTCFGFDALELQLLGTAPDEGERQVLRDQLARLVEASAGRPDLIATALEAVEAEQRRTKSVEALRNYGLAIQDAVREALKEHGLDVELVDRGFDFKVAVEAGDVAEDVAIASFEVREWLVEVKATVRDEVALTPLQARTAGEDPSRFILCVVNLESIPDAATPVSDLVPLVRDKSRFILDLGPDAALTIGHVTAAAAGQVGIKYDNHLRYTVRQARWVEGMTLDSWVQGIKASEEAGAARLDQQPNDGVPGVL